MWALPFSLSTLQATGDAFLVEAAGESASVTRDQTLVYVESPKERERRLVWLDRTGNRKEPVLGVEGVLGPPSLSPDGRFVALVVEEGHRPELWVYNLARGSRTQLATNVGVGMGPVWEPGGEAVAYTAVRPDGDEVYVRRADGGGPEQALTGSVTRKAVSDWSRDGKFVVYNIVAIATGNDVWYLERGENGETWDSRPLFQEMLGQYQGRLSPDGSYIAYTNNVSGRAEICVQPFPDGGPIVTVSSNGGAHARWSRDGKEIYYVEGDTLIAASVSTQEAFSLGQAQRLFQNPGLAAGYDVSTDGKRFILTEPLEGPEPPPPAIQIVENWYAEFRERNE